MSIWLAIRNDIVGQHAFRILKHRPMRTVIVTV